MITLALDIQLHTLGAVLHCWHTGVDVSCVYVCVCLGYLWLYTYVYMRDLCIGKTPPFNCMTSTMRSLHVTKCFLALPWVPKYMFPSIAIETKPPSVS